MGAMTSLLTGTVTFLFTDIEEGSLPLARTRAVILRRPVAERARPE